MWIFPLFCSNVSYSGWLLLWHILVFIFHGKFHKEKNSIVMGSGLSPGIILWCSKLIFFRLFSPQKRFGLDMLIIYIWSSKWTYQISILFFTFFLYLFTYFKDNNFACTIRYKVRCTDSRKLLYIDVFYIKLMAVNYLYFLLDLSFI